MMRPTLLLPCLLLLASPAARVDAADAHVGVHPERGEMVLLRDVNARPAYRPAPPGIALIVDPTPNREIDSALGTGEMSDDEFAAMSTGRLDAGGHQATLPQQITGLYHAGSVGIIMSGWLGAMNYGVIIANEVDSQLMSAAAATPALTT